MKKLRVMVLYGGRSEEHEVSLRSAASVLKNLDPKRYEVVPVAIDHQGKWHLNTQPLVGRASAEHDVLPVNKDAPPVFIPPYAQNLQEGETRLVELGSQQPSLGVDVVFPVMHGNLSEDGTIQGFLELAGLPYVGAGVLASAVGMDKEFSKRLVRDAGINVVPYVTLRQGEWLKNKAVLKYKIEQELGYPCFVKPANSGSSVGVHKVKSPLGLEEAITDAFRYDLKILVEKAVDAHEIELSVLEELDITLPPRVSVPGEIVPSHEFYSYEAKYLDENGADLKIPASLDFEQTQKVQKTAQDVFVALGCEGMGRVDLFVDKRSGEVYFNEINTIPGFTSISMYPKLWEASGLSYSDLLSHLLELAIARHQRKNALLRFYPGNS